jgi:D-alanyl-D-alanine endopeptidase (penicillin-binding protein 7)
MTRDCGVEEGAGESPDMPQLEQRELEGAMLRTTILALAVVAPALCWGQGADSVEVNGLPRSQPLPVPTELDAEQAQRPKDFGAPDWAALSRRDQLELRSAAALVIDQEDGQLLYAKNTDAVMPIASITKLMTAVVVLDAGLPLEEPITIDRADMDYLKGTRSRLKIGTTLTRRQLLRLALMASENRAAAALARTYPGGTGAFVQAMNQKARQLGMRDTHFRDSTGLDPGNVSTAMDLALLVNTSYNYPLIRDFSTTESYRLAFEGNRRKRMRMLAFRNSNGLVRSNEWEIGLQKTGYISEAGRCLVMQARIATRPVIIVLLDSWGKFTRIADANRIKRWIESFEPAPLTTTRRLRMS